MLRLANVATGRIFLPWIILAALGDRWFPAALLLALAAAAIATARQLFNRSLKILDTVTFAFFVLVATGVLGFGWMGLATWMTLLVNLTLMGIAWGSLLAGTPFTIQYAREEVAPELWHAPLFLRITRRITAVWGLSFFLSAIVSLYRHATGATGLASQYAWIVFAFGAALFTVYFPGWYRARAVRGTARSSVPIPKNRHISLECRPERGGPVLVSFFGVDPANLPVLTPQRRAENGRSP